MDLVVIEDDTAMFGIDPYYSRVVAGVMAAIGDTDASALTVRESSLA